jgi:Ca2+-binding RTX toxin-like protein
MIKVKATQARQAETGPSRQAFLEAGIEKTPVGLAAIGAILVSVALYVKGVISPAFGTETGEDRTRGNAPQDDAAQGPLPADAVTAELDIVRGEESEAEVIPFEPRSVGRARGSSSLAIDMEQPIDVLAMARASLRGPSSQQRDDLSPIDTRPPPVRDWGGTDLRPASGGAGGGGSGGGGGGGGSESAPLRPSQNEPNQPGTRNRAPIVPGPVTLRSVPAGETVFIAFAALLAGVVDPDRDVLRVVGLEVSAGTIAVTEDGILYTAPDEAIGPVRFTFKVSDGEYSVRQSATSTIEDRAPIMGTEGADSIVGTPFDDRIDALGGNDTVVALAGHDIVAGGDGDDVVDGGDGADTLFGGRGNDLVRGGAGDDIVWAGEGNDTVFGDAGNDVLYGEDGDDSVSGGTGADVAYGGAGADSLSGDAGDDVLLGGDGADSLSGGEGRDLLVGGAGADTVDGGAGDDIVLGDMDGADDSLHGGVGQDTLDYADATDALRIDLVQGTASGADIGTDTISGFETIRAGAGDDHVVVGDAAVKLAGGTGDDLFEFRAPEAPAAPQETAGTGDLGTPTTAAATAIHEILDFSVGDRIRIGSWYIERDDGEISGQARDGSARATFELKPLGPGETLDLNQPFRLRIEERDGHERTVVDVVVDGVDDPDYVIALNGLQSLVYSYANT